MPDVNAPDRPRTARYAVRRQHLLDTARRIFVEKGFHQAGIAQIAQASGIAVGQIYRDFANKEEIVAAICEANLIAWLEEAKLQAAVERRDFTAIRAWITRIATDTPSAENRRLMSELLAEVGRNPKIAAINLAQDARLRRSLDSALHCLAPLALPEQRFRLADFIIGLGHDGALRTPSRNGSRRAAPLRCRSAGTRIDESCQEYPRGTARNLRHGPPKVSRCRAIVSASGQSRITG
ncbi:MULTISPECIES: TetR/AcrR family transcriptional regulator [Novosphingobium]|uniref:TetR/AcrR family transcriptional regulator n=1 Tax=Novosphingobium TaxID=165696 RepID=UPI0022F29386|nr:TetR/AcrR family transcriptional regulator [Novosphingobium resinovorum]